MFLELHLIQNFAPSNLNRDDTNAPKDCDFGGFRRARVSSQCIKRSIRENFKSSGLLEPQFLASRTKLLSNTIVERLVKEGKAENEARTVVETLLSGAKLKIDKDNKTQYLLFLGQKEIDDFTNLCLEHWEQLSQITISSNTEGKKPAKDAKKSSQDALPNEIKNLVLKAMDGGKAVDLAMFGRMLADLPDKNIDAACQVAHAISTNKVNIEFDFFTAVDDLAKAQDTGAGMLGTVEFNSACFYRYANVDIKQLQHNLGQDQELTLKAISAFIQASVNAIPTGKQNSMAAQNPPSFVLAVLRKTNFWSLANAFVKPVQPSPQNDYDLVKGSIKNLANYWEQLLKVYGDKDILGKWFICLDSDAKPNSSLSDADTGSLDNLVEKVSQQLTTPKGGN